MKKNLQCCLDRLELRRLLSTIYVDATAPGPTHDGSSWTDAYTTLEQALTAASNGTTVEVGQGTYKPTTGADRSATFQLESGVAVYGGYAGYGQSDPDARNVADFATILSGAISGDSSGYSYDVVTGSGVSSSAILDGFTITDGNADGGPYEEGGGMINVAGSATLSDCTFTSDVGLDGGGIANLQESSPQIDSCTFSNDSVTASGGAMYNDDSSPFLSGCTFEDNTAPSSGSCGAIDNTDSSSPIFSNCQFTDNSAGYAGAMIFDSSSASINNCTFTGNSANNGSGGAIYDHNATVVTIAGCTFTENSSTSSGAAVYAYLSQTVLSNCTLNGNNASEGGAIEIDGGSMRIEDCTLSFNTGDQTAGAVAVGDSANFLAINCDFVENTDSGNGGALYTDDATSTLTNCTFTGNSATYHGGALYNADGAVANVTNSILSGDSAMYGSEIYNADTASATVNYSDVEGNYQGTANIGSDPEFVRAPLTNGASDAGDEDISSSSPVVNVGSNSAITGTTTDLDGNPRIVNSTVDMGAYEAQGTNLVITAQPSGVGAGSGFSLVVSVEDQNGNVAIPDDSEISVAIASGSTGATLGGTASVAASNGVATFSNLTLTKAGTYTLAVSDGSLTGATSNSFTISAASTATLDFTGEPANGIAGQSLGSVSVKAEDQYGNPVDGADVTIGVTPGQGSGTLGGTLSASTSAGVATFSDLSLNLPGTYMLVASSAGVSSTSSSFAITYAGPQLVFSAEPTGTTAGGKLSAITVETDNTTGGLITTGKSKIILTLSSGGKLLGSASEKVVAGKATFSKLSIQKAGSYTLTASDPTFGSVTSTAFTITPAAPSKISFNPQPANTSANSAFNVQVSLIDRYGNSAGDGQTVTLTFGSHPSGASLSSSQVADDGAADFDGLTLSAAGNYTLLAMDGKLKAISKKIVVS